MQLTIPPPLSLRNELLRIPLLGTWVNKGKKSEGLSVETKRPRV
jgi:hypothetical protein